MHAHRAEAPVSVACAVLTVSDTRTLETDSGGALATSLLEGMVPRVQSGQNGAQWLRMAKDKFQGEFTEVTAAYLEHQRIGNPVHQWSI